MSLSDFKAKWHQTSAGPEMARTLVALCTALQREQKSRKTRCRDAASRYEMRRLGGLNPAAYYRAGAFSPDGTDRLVWPMERSIANSAQAKLAGQQKPKVQFVTTDADWSTKRKAKKLDRFVEGQFMQRVGVYNDLWELMLRVFLDACIFTTGGAAKIFADEEEGRVQYERVFTWEIFVDPVEARHGQPLNMFHVYPYDRDQLLASFPDKADAINAMPEYVDEDDAEKSSSARVSNQVRVCEAWRLPFSKDKPGRHVITVDEETLLDEPWMRNEFPFVWIRWSQHLAGFDSTSLVEEIASICDVINHLAQRMEDSTRRTSMGALIYEEGAVRDEDLRTNEDAILIRTKPGAPPPQYVQAVPISQGHVEFLNLNVDKVHDISGVSEMATQGDRPAGVTAAVAIRAVEDVQSKRFSVIFRAYESVFLALARHTIACTRELAEANADFSSRWAGSKFLKTIKFSDADLDEDQYIIQLYSAPAVKNTPADRLQLITELNQAGKVSDESLLEVIKYLDSARELESVSRQRELLESYIDSWLDATPEQEEEGTFRYRAPIPWMPSLPDALLQVSQAFLEAEMDGVPSFNEEFFIRFMTELDALIQQKEQRAAQAQAIAAGKAQPQGAAPVMPPGAPPAGPPQGVPNAA